MKLPFPPEVGDAVQWYVNGDPNGPAFPGVVVALGMGTQVDIHILSPDSDRLLQRWGAKHVGDGGIREDERVTNGCWDYSPRLKLLMQLVTDLMTPAKAA